MALMDCRREHLSYTQINQFLRICPLQFAFQRIFRLTPSFVTESLPFGVAMHRTAEHLWGRRVEGQDATEDELADLFADLWQRAVQDTEQLRFQKGDFDSLLAQGQAMIRLYRRELPDDLEIVGYDVPFQVPLVDRHGEVLETPLVGEFDLLVRERGRLCVVDLKTAGQRYPESRLATDLQPTVYLYALQANGGPPASFRWDVLVKNKQPVLVRYAVERTADDFARLVELIKLMQAMIEAGHFPPHEGSYFCGGCGFQEACRDWYQGTPAPMVPARERLASLAV